ncbi:hypothetical protein KUTeg_008317 [Tegillarca granosa]|uniref:Putative sodium-coupled neutral amino acid transporter 11 n=1 Tax=Tegillarca granosa TaxID=220873 RepID=A0ABQ9FB08_TEGGR|nr:hypothetical protein KUTeg_008317 [Tegillarca granosa]
MASGTSPTAGEGSYILDRSRTQSDFSETSSVGDTRQLVEDKSKENDGSRSNIPMTSFNFINSIIGSGIIGMPYALKQSGFVMGIALLVLVGAITAMISYNVIIGDTITKIIIRIGGADYLGRTVLGNRQFIIFLVTLLVTLPLSLYRNIAKLSKWAFVSIVFVFFIIVCVCVRLGTFSEQIPYTENAWSFANYNFAQAVGIMAFGDLMENYCHDDDLMNVARFAFALTIMFTYPVECFVTREVVENAFFSSSVPSPLWRHLAVTMGISVCCMAVSMATDCLGVVLEFNGVIVACPLAYIIPPICIMKLKQDPILSKGNILPILTVSFGVIVAVMGTIMVFYNIEEGLKGCSHGVELGYCRKPSVMNYTTTTIPVSNMS